MKKSIPSYCLILFLFIGVGSYSQVQNNIWYFGNQAGLDFNSGSPVTLTDGMLDAYEGSASIADSAGNLLFYTDGVTVWNKVHGVMPNGSGLLGNTSTSQSALIVPVPGSSTNYYIFTIAELGGAMTYSIVDMTLASGLGDVTSTKNSLLHSTVSEKQTAYQRCDGSIWVISHEWETNTFFADLITTTGILPSILSSVGTIHTGGSQPYFNSVGTMKISQQGDHLALAIRDAAIFEVFDFDKNTGIVSNSKALYSDNYFSAYGVEFSQDGTKLYGTTILGGQLIQFNLLAGSGSAADILTSAIILDSSLTYYLTSLQIGPDNKIYVGAEYSGTAGPGFLGVINNPNLSDTLSSAMKLYEQYVLPQNTSFQVNVGLLIPYKIVLPFSMNQLVELFPILE